MVTKQVCVNSSPRVKAYVHTWKERHVYDKSFLFVRFVFDHFWLWRVFTFLGVRAFLWLWRVGPAL